MVQVAEGQGGEAGAAANPAEAADGGKSRQILDGARRVFLARGFDGASMGEIARAAGVSKGTLYVYFADKEALFEALVARERERLFDGLDGALDSDRPLAERLGDFGRRFAALLCSDPVVRAQRIVIASADRRPELGARFHEAGARLTQAHLRRLVEREVAAGRLRVADPGLAAQQFIELATAGLWRPRLFGAAGSPPAPAAIEAVVASAVAMWLAAHDPARP